MASSNGRTANLTNDDNLEDGDSYQAPTYDVEVDDAPSDGQETPNGANIELLPRDRQSNTAYYDYASEKSLSHADAKLIYQRHQLESQGTLDPLGPLKRAWTAPSDADARSISRQTSVGSRLGSTSQYQSALPAGLGASDKPADPGNVQTPDIKAFDANHGGHSESTDNQTSADQAARNHSLHPALPHEHKPSLAEHGIHGAGAGIGIGSGSGGFAASDAHITSELSTIYTNIQRILDLRHKYIRLSLQRPGDNPKDDGSWSIYPPPPAPVWDEENNRPIVTAAQQNGSSDSANPMSPTRRRRKPGQDIGEDFELSEVPVPDESEMTFRLDENGVFQAYENAKSAELESPILAIPTIRDYYMDLDTILSISSDGPSKSFAFRRLQYLEGKYNLYFLLNEYQEMADSKKVPHRDFYNVRKVDTHVHHSSCMNQKHLLRFIKSKMKKSPDEVVMFRDGKNLTLREVFESINLTAYDLSIDTLDMHAHTDSFHRFDKFNLKYNPIGESRLRTIFLKTDNQIQGRYLAELTKEVIADLESSKYQMVEWRISVYGRSLDEWDKLAAWVVDNKLFSHNVRWLIQVPRLYDIYKASNLMDDFEQVIINVFQPLFEATKKPSSHPKLAIFLQRVIGFDSVDDESKPERRLFKKFPPPKEWNTKQNPPYSYWIYYLFANITSLNAWRKQRGMNTFHLRPHCGEAGETDHLAAAVLCCHSISHGILLRKVPLMQYIFYLEQIGIAMSPLSNNALFLAYERNPFMQYFRRGLNVSLSTDDPLQIAFTKEPLIEEYSVAAQIYKLNAVDMCELAKNSVLQSGFEHALKQRWLGTQYNHPGVSGNNVAKTNVPNIREAFRHETLLQELSMIDKYTAGTNFAQPVSSFNLPPTSSKSTDSYAHAPASPSASMRTNPSVQNAGDNATYKFASLPGSSIPAHNSPIFPAQSARYPPNIAPKDWSSENRTQQASGTRTASNTAQSGAQDNWADTTSPSHLDGAQPRIFPGIVHERTRRGSLRNSSFSEKDTEGGTDLAASLSNLSTGDNTASSGAIKGEDN